MKVLVTGNKGYIGTVLTGMLAAAGHRVRGVDNGLFSGCSIKRLDETPTVRKDIRDTEVADFAGNDAVVHLAGLSNDALGNLDPDLTEEINHFAAVRVAELAKAAGVSRFVFASSCSVYGAGGEHWLDESAPFNPVTPYARAKAAAEVDIAGLADAQFTPVYLRPATAYGMSPMIRFDLVLNNLVAWASATGQVRLKSDGTNWRPLVHVKDIGRVVLWALNAPTDVVHSEAFNVGATQENFRIVDVARIVEAAVPEATIEFAADASADRRSYRVEFRKLESANSGFEPRWRAQDGARQIYEAIGTLRLTTEDFEGARYNRVDHLRKHLSEGRLGTDLRWLSEAKSARVT